ncbi:MAG: hypothetical protein AB7L90_08960 [Hyphomicrobiaceae bacterium]
MDIFGLGVQLICGTSGGAVVTRNQRGDTVGVLIAGAVGGLLGGQIVERSMSQVLIPLQSGTPDLGATLALAGGAGLGGVVAGWLISRLSRHLQR